LKQASHPHIARVHEILHDKDCYFISSELHEGDNLQKFIDKGLTEIQTATILKQILLALYYMHSK